MTVVPETCMKARHFLDTKGREGMNNEVPHRERKANRAEREQTEEKSAEEVADDQRPFEMGFKFQA